MTGTPPQLKLLLIDDDIQEKHVIDRILKVLTDAPIGIDHATRCSEGVGLLNRDNYDLVLLDNRLSDTISAKFSVPFIRSAFSRAPVAIISSDVSVPYLQDPTQLGVDHIIDKADLIGFLRQWLKSTLPADLYSVKDEVYRPRGAKPDTTSGHAVG